MPTSCRSIELSSRHLPAIIYPACLPQRQSGYIIASQSCRDNDPLNQLAIPGHLPGGRFQLFSSGTWGVLFVPACPHPAHLPCARVCLPDNLMIPAVAFLFSTMAWQNTPSLGESAQRPSGKPAHCCARSAPYHGVNWYPSTSASTAAK